MRWADIAADGIAGFEIEFANLRRRDIDVVGAGQVIVVRRTKKSIAIGQDFEHAFGKDVAFFFALGLKDLEDQVLFAEAAGARDFQGARNTAQFSDVFFFEFGDRHVHLRKRVVSGGPERGKCSWSDRRGLRVAVKMQNCVKAEPD